MKPIGNDDCNFTFVLGGGTEENDLPCVRDDWGQTVTSFWQAEEGEDIAGADVLWVWLTQSPDVAVQIAWADTLDDAKKNFEPLETFRDEDGDGACVIPLPENRKNWLMAGSTIALRVHALPTPPVCLAFSYSEVAEEAA